MNIILAIIHMLKLHVFRKSWQYTDLCCQIQSAEGGENVESNTELEGLKFQEVSTFISAMQTMQVLPISVLYIFSLYTFL